MTTHPRWFLCFLILFGTPKNTATAFVPVSKARDFSSTSFLHALPKLLNVAVVGAGPSGLLLAHLLLRQDNNIQVTLIDGRPDPRIVKGKTEQRAYALGIGIRGRTAIRQVDEALWRAVKQRGYESERFQLHLGELVIPLRSEMDGSDEERVEPSLLTFQSELCAALLEELERRHHPSSERLTICFATKVDSCDFDSMNIKTENGEEMGSFDLIVGCDGVNSPVRTTMEKTFATFETTKKRLPGEFKVVCLNSAPPNVDPTAVSLLIPGGAFVEPTGNDGSCCILFSGRGERSPLLTETNDKTAVVEALQSAFPKWEESHESIADQLMAQKMAGSASSVVCNTYHYSNKVALAGDAAHATGGVSGQGVNSALIDSVILSECIQADRESLDQALLKYSQKQVPEGKALYDLSFGPKPKGLKGISWALRNAQDAIFRGRFGIGQVPLQTRLTTDLTSFAEIRRELDEFYDEPFPSGSEFRERLISLHKVATEAPT